MAQSALLRTSCRWVAHGESSWTSCPQAKVESMPMHIWIDVGLGAATYLINVCSRCVGDVCTCPFWGNFSEFTRESLGCYRPSRILPL
jgi:hypothetical protein